MMRCRMVALNFLVLISSFVCATWKVGTIVNKSDLVLESAWYEKPVLTPIPYLTTKLEQAITLPKPVSIVFNYTVADTAQGHSIIKAQNGYQISLADNPTHFVKSGRIKVKKKSVSKNPSIKKQYGDLAQVFLEVVSPLDNQPKEMTHAVLEYEQENQVIDLYLLGIGGNYKIQLKAVPPTQAPAQS